MHSSPDVWARLNWAWSGEKTGDWGRFMPGLRRGTAGGHLPGSPQWAGREEQVPEEQIPVGCGLLPEPAVKETGLRRQAAPPERALMRVRSTSIGGDDPIGGPAAGLAEEGELGALILDARRAAEAVGGHCASHARRVARGKIADIKAHAAGALAPFDLFKVEEEILVEQAEARQNRRANAQTCAKDGFDGDRRGYGGLSLEATRRKQAEDRQRNEFLGQRRQRRKGALQAATGPVKLAAGDCQIGRPVEPCGKRSQSARLKPRIVVEQQTQTRPALV